jgi:hypothetical protein
MNTAGKLEGLSLGAVGGKTKEMPVRRGQKAKADPPFDFAQGRLCGDDKQKNKESEKAKAMARMTRRNGKKQQKTGANGLGSAWVSS